MSKCKKCNGRGKVKDRGSGFRKSAGLFVVTGIPILASDSEKRCNWCHGTGKAKNNES